MDRTLVGLGMVLVFLAVGLGTPTAQKQAQQAPKVVASAPINLNAATVAQLEALPGIGPKMAERIVDYRDKNGGFKKIEELMNIQGIGEKNFLRIKDLITVTPPKAKETGGQPKQ